MRSRLIGPFMVSMLAMGNSLLPAVAQGPTPKAELVVLGSGGPRMTGRAASSNAIVLDGKARILVDAGSGAAVRLGEAGLDIDGLDIVLLTHLHIDHSGDLPSVAKARGMIHQGPMTFRVFGPAARGVFPSTTHFVASIFDAHGIFAYQRTFGAEEKFAATDLSIDRSVPPREILRDGDMRIQSVATNHGEAPSVAYRIDGPGWSVAFSGDLDPSGLPNLTRLAADVDLLVFNCAVLDPPGSPAKLYTRHTAPKQIGEVARAAGVKRLLLTHIPPLVEKAPREALASVSAAYSGPVELARDRMRVPLSNEDPGGAR
jgi:ribonuclease BN (tRNA processing enzyme)